MDAAQIAALLRRAASADDEISARIDIREIVLTRDEYASVLAALDAMSGNQFHEAA